MRLKHQKFVQVVLVGVFLSFAVKAVAADFACEVMSVKGSVYVTGAQEARHEIKQGDLLNQGDKIEVGKDSYVDIAYDKEWNNLSRIKENSLVAIRSVFPTALDMARGDIFSRLKQLPKNSSFEIATPAGRFRMTRGELYAQFADVVGSSSYRDLGQYHYPMIPYKAFSFLVREEKASGKSEY